MYMNKFNINKIKYDMTDNKRPYRITFINVRKNIGKNDIYVFTDNKRNNLKYNKVCRRLINFKLFYLN